MFKIQNFVNILKFTFPQFFGKGFPPSSFEGLCLIGVGHHQEDVLNGNYNNITNNNKSLSVKDLIGDGFLWAVPKHRRTIERRMKMKYGTPGLVLKMLVPKLNLRYCNHCGHDHEVGVLCPHCYNKVKVETEAMQEKIQQKLGLESVDSEVIVLYKGEQGDNPNEFYKGKRIIEMDKPRPQWFSKNLLQKSTQQPATTKEVKPTELG